MKYNDVHALKLKVIESLQKEFCRSASALNPTGKYGIQLSHCDSHLITKTCRPSFFDQPIYSQMKSMISFSIVWPAWQQQWNATQAFHQRSRRKALFCLGTFLAKFSQRLLKIIRSTIRNC